MTDLKLELENAREYVNERYGLPDCQWQAEARENDLFDNAFTDVKAHADVRLAIVFVRSSDPDDIRKHDFTHESTHLLNPAPRCRTSYLEEAAATVISLERPDYIDPTGLRARKLTEMKQVGNARYLDAYNDLMRLLKEYPDQFIKTLRGPNRRSLSIDIQSHDITKLIPGTDAIAQRLCRKFYTEEACLKA